MARVRSDRTRARHPDVERIKSELDHPVIDSDGHTVEITSVLFDYVQSLGGTAAVAGFESYLRSIAAPDPDDPRRWTRQPGHWVFPARTLDRATASLPRLYHERMDEMGLDFSLVYPSSAIIFPEIDDEDLRRIACRAVNQYLAEMHEGLGDRILPVGVVPMHTPEEAIAELDHVVHALGIRAVVIPSFVKRPLGSATGGAYRVDSYGVDSEHDYDPFWNRCVELGVVPGVHTSTAGMPLHESESSWAFTHIGQFSSGAEVFCRSLVMGGVFHRVPGLRVAALEGGVGWALSLYTGMLGHWRKRNGRESRSMTRSTSTTPRWPSLSSPTARRRGESGRVTDDLLRTATATPRILDEFGVCPFETAEELRDLFTSHIYVGCEADDPMNVLAFDSHKNALGARVPGAVGIRHQPLGRHRHEHRPGRGARARGRWTHHAGRFQGVHVL